MTGAEIMHYGKFQLMNTAFCGFKLLQIRQPAGMAQKKKSAGWLTAALSEFGKYKTLVKR